MFRLVLKSLTAGVIVLASAIPATALSAADNKPTLVSVDAINAVVNKAKPTGGTANCSNDGATAATESATTGWVTTGGVAHLNTSTVPASVTSAVADIQSSFNAWSSVGGPAFTVATDGTVTKQTANHQTDVLWGRTSGSALAVTYTWTWNDGTIESDTVLNKSFAWRELGAEGDGCYENQPYYDVANIATHEFGHIYGLDHPNPGRFETMYAYGYSGETLKRSPGTGDAAAIASLYN